ncbi:hypothetical protein [Planctomyces sp. SH-PL62]|uniref:hypothetical protein n=1 Tax=Planctomyces sp. SH-PL62 TaxID=1636152 RepID=UPI00078EBA3B|nr:hypothetical protein [Planctomyces sp. SH-PL62]AMV38918.1 hypothetical protein VT85_15895 [Planctomyces sp. SH-PL62]
MTAEQFETVLEAIRRRQGTRHPLVQIATADQTIRGRVGNFIADRSPRRSTNSPYGIVSIEPPGLVPGPLKLVQVVEILDDGVGELPARRTALAATGV